MLQVVLSDPRSPGDLQLTAYDAGGHEEYQEMHSIFLTKETLYLLLWNVAQTGIP